MLFNTLGIAHKELPVFISLLDIFAGVVAQLIAVCGLLVLTKQKFNFFPGVDLYEGARACMWMHSFTPAFEHLLFTF